MDSDTTNTPRHAYDALTHDLIQQRPTITASHMFGVNCLLNQGKLFALFQNGGMAFKLGGDEHREALALPGAQLWFPSGRKRAMSNWVHVPASHAGLWPQLAAQSLAYVTP